MRKRHASVFVISAFVTLVVMPSLPAASPQQAPETPRFRVGVDAVRIDAVVTDGNGRIVTDLTAADFEVRQDGKRQAVTFAQYMPVLTGPDPVGNPAAGAPRDVANTAPSAAPAVNREDVQRTFALVVDDLSLSVESLQNTRRALHAFVDRELRPTDLVALVRTGGSAGSQSFSTDRRVLHAAIEGLRWNVFSRNAVESYEPLNIYALGGSAGPGGGSATGIDPNDFKALTAFRSSLATAGSFGALNLVIRGTRALPGRKAVVFVSEGFTMTGALEPDTRVRLALDRVIEQATRAGVVIYSFDCRGLQTAGLQAADNFKAASLEVGAMDAMARGLAKDRSDFNRDTQEGLKYIAEQTGGFAVLNTNDLSKGLSRITDDVRGYYVIGYVPQAGTFARPGEKPSMHKISIDVTRRGLRVKTRKAFLGVSDPPDDSAPATPAHELVRAATSPFTAAALSLHATSLPAYTPAEGMFVRSLLHVDARGLTFAPGDAGKQTAAVDVLGMVFDQDGLEVARVSTGFSVALTDATAADALRDGVAYTFHIPVRRPGGYQVRFAIRDQRSGALGSAGEFVDMPDMAGGAFALSGIVLRREEDGAAAAAGSDRLAVTPAQAVRIFPPGSRLSYAYEIYNATTMVRSAPSIWRGPEQVFSPAPDTLTVPSGGDRRFAAGGGLALGALRPGSYVLQISAVTADAQRPGRSRTAIQRIGFEVQ
ncbi:MAG: VWA domain-containing protein [Vicinamibacterales bacterium]